MAPRIDTADRRIVGWPALTSDDQRLGTVKMVRDDGSYEVAATDGACVRLAFAKEEPALWKNATGRPIRSTAPHPAD